MPDSVSIWSTRISRINIVEKITITAHGDERFKLDNHSSEGLTCIFPFENSDDIALCVF